MVIDKKFITREYYRRKFFKKIGKYFPESQYWFKASQFYLASTGKELNYSHPKDLNEKLMWLTRYWRDPLKTLCADKFLVRDYIKENGLSDILIPLLGVWDNADEIKFDDLPQQFVLKCNHGSGYNIICLDKTKLDIDNTRNTLNKWLATDFSTIAQELHYQAIPRKIVCEKLISSSAPIEYQFWCLNGIAESILVCRKNYDDTYDAASYSLDWNRLFDRKNENPNISFEKPVILNQLIAIAEILSKPFPFVRADFYVVDDKIYFAELTFTPAGNVLTAYKEEFINRLGKKLILPKKFIK